MFSVPIVSGDFAQFSPGSDAPGVSYRVTIPSSTASSGSGPIYFQMKAPSTIQWFALGQGPQMTGANIFIVYASSSSNITISPRSGKGEFEPVPNSNAVVSLLEGSGISNGVMTANVRCDSCLSWSGGTLKLNDAASPWIWSMKLGSPLNSADPSESLTQHTIRGPFTFDLSKASGSDSQDPFSEQPDQPESTSGSSSSHGSTISGSTIVRKRATHAIIMAVAFLLLFPSFALSIRVIPYAKTVPHIHAPLQLLTLCLAVIGFAYGLSLARDLKKVDGYHPIIGMVVIGYLVLFQPALGIVQHRHYRRTKQRSVYGVIHLWLGRTILALALVNGGLGFRFSGIGNPGVPKIAVIIYCIIAGVVGFLYIVINVFSKARSRALRKSEASEPFIDREGMEMGSKRSRDPNTRYDPVPGP